MTKGQPRARRATRAYRLAVASAALGLLAACGMVAGIDGLEVGECKGGGVCGAEAGTAETAPPVEEEAGPKPVEGGTLDAGPCKSLHGPKMVRVGTASNNFCIDSTEVTVKQYREFTVAKGTDVSGQPPVCAWNTSYAAGFGGADEIPIAGVDWCDAYAFCAWAGKRLCGKHVDGKHVGAISEAELGDFNSHEWLLTCSNLGQLRYPYGGIQQPTACNTGENDAGRTLAVGTKPLCQGGFAGVYDMVGNLWEWFDGPCALPDAGPDAMAPDGGPDKQECVVKGGAFLNSGTNLDCRVDGRGASRDRRGQEIGIRCCSD